MIRLGAGLVQGLELFIEEFSEIPMEKMIGKNVVGEKKTGRSLLWSFIFVVEVKKEEVTKKYVQQGTPASVYAIIIFVNSECTHYRSFFKLLQLLCAFFFT